LGNAQKRTEWTLALPLGHYYWSVQAIDAAYAGSPFAAERDFYMVSGVEDQLPRELSFALASPNPAAGEARFRVGLPRRAHVELSVHDVAGRSVARLVDGYREAGFHTVNWQTGVPARGAGVYFARLTAEGRTFTRRFVLLR
jgi:hypothetical protein